MAHDRILKRLREKIWKQQYVITVHARAEMVEDNLDRFDLELAILSGQILERQRDQDTGEWKYRVHGASVDGASVETIVKIGPTGKLIFITIYLS
jgi:hypothetical protein